jgi:hypothetical protein
MDRLVLLEHPVRELHGNIVAIARDFLLSGARVSGLASFSVLRNVQPLPMAVLVGCRRGVARLLLLERIGVTFKRAGC